MQKPGPGKMGGCVEPDSIDEAVEQQPNAQFHLGRIARGLEWGKCAGKFGRIPRGDGSDPRGDLDAAGRIGGDHQLRLLDELPGEFHHVDRPLTVPERCNELERGFPPDLLETPVRQQTGRSGESAVTGVS